MTANARRRDRLIAGLLALLLGGCAFLAVWLRPWETGSTVSREPVPKLVPKLVAVAPGVFLLGRTSPAAVYVIETSDGLVLIDSGLESGAEAVLEQLAELRLSVGSVKAILLTHVHADHSLGAGRLRDLSGARIHAGKGDCPALQAGGPREAFFSTFHMPALTTHGTTIDVELVGGEVLQFGDTRIEALAAPGHTRGSMCYLLERKGQRILFTGDVIQSLSPSTANVVGTYTTYLPPIYGGDARDYLASLRRLRELPVPDLVLPGHPKMDSIPQSPRLALAMWHDMLETAIRKMAKLVARQEADGADYLDGRPKELLPGLQYLGDHGGACVYCVDTKSGVCLFDAPGGPSLVEFLAARFKELGWEDRKLTAVLLTSADPDATSGLAALVHKHGCKVVAAKAGLEAVKQACPATAEIVTEAQVAASGLPDMQVIPLAGRGQAPVAYRLRWADKTVLVSGRIPTKLNVPSTEQLLKDLSAPRGNAVAYRKSLERLRALKSELWLPALAVHGQNANLYDREWDDVLDANRDAF